MFQISWLKKLSVIYVRVRKCVCSTQTQIHLHIRICVCVFLVCTHNPFKQKHSLAIVRTHWEASNVYAMLWNRKTSPRDNWGHDSCRVWGRTESKEVKKKLIANDATIIIQSPWLQPGLGPSLSWWWGIAKRNHAKFASKAGRICTRPQSQFNNIQLKICVNKNQLMANKTQQKRRGKAIGY